MPQFAPLCNARLKIERSKKHINDLNGSLRDFLKTDFYRLEVKPYGEAPRNRLEFECRDVPKEIGLIVGDAIHNSRAALDVAIGQMVFEKTGVFSDYAKFPFYGTREALINACNGGDIKKAGANVVTLIVDRIRPYAGGDDFLCALHALDIQDKHVLLLPHITITEITGIDLEDDWHNVFSDMSLTTDQTGQIMIPVDIGAKLHIKNKGQPSFAVLFGKGLPMEGKPIVPTLVQFAQAVEHVVTLFEAL